MTRSLHENSITFRHGIYARKLISFSLAFDLTVIILNSLVSFCMQFVNFTEIMNKNATSSEKEASFALAALMEIPFQYKAVLEHGILG